MLGPDLISPTKAAACGCRMQGVEWMMCVLYCVVRRVTVPLKLWGLRVESFGGVDDVGAAEAVGYVVLFDGSGSGSGR